MNPDCRLTVMTWIGLIVANVSLHAADPFAEGVRPTDPLTPVEQLKTFHLPPGFEIQLVASEPQIAKPMNLAFDARGRLWVTDSYEYPFAAPLDRPGRDSIKILEDTNGDGHADKVTVFADGLNIPTGVYPYKNGVIAWSIPNIWYFEDADGDGKADKREVLFGPLGWERDTHGMNSSFRRGFDGWLYITHGFNNNSTIRGKDGSEIRLNSGNTYRVRLDGSRVEQHTWGQVNPFGMCFDPLGNIYTADCHSAPIYQLLRGGYYPSFGKPHDGLGFAPTLMEHTHGSTAICGIVYYADNQWPAEFRDNIFVGNVMTSRVNRDTLFENGTSKRAREEPDFVRTDDPWFRPVDLQLGPDGAFYIADFYNRIIGHYEVPLMHPGRDRERGRIWRVVYKNSTHRPPAKFDLTQAEPAELIKELGSSNLTRRMLAMNEIADRLGAAAVTPLRRMMKSNTANAFQKAHGLWLLHRLGSLDSEILNAAATHSDRLVRTHTMQVLSETNPWNESQRSLALRGLKDPDPHVRRAAADALGQHPHHDHIDPLINLRTDVPPSDNHLLHVVRMALRNQLKPEPVFAKIQIDQLSEAKARAIADVALAIPNSNAGLFLLKFVQKFGEPNSERLSEYLRHAARFIPTDQVDSLAQVVRKQFANQSDLQLSLFRSVQAGAAQRGVSPTPLLRQWGADLAAQLFASTEQIQLDWVNLPVDGLPASLNPWILQERRSANGQNVQLISSLPPGGEPLTGILQSKPFVIPSKLSFLLAGHDGHPNHPPQKKNSVRLRASSTGEVLAEIDAPRTDVAQQIEWDLKSHAGREGYLEVTDRHTGNAFAWLAVGHFEPAVVRMPSVPPRELAEHQLAAADLARTLQLTEQEANLRQLLASSFTDLEVCSAAARAFVALRPNSPMASLAPLISEPAVPVVLRRRISQSLAQANETASAQFIIDSLRTAPYRVQVKLAESLAANAKTAAQLVELVSQGQASTRLVLERTVREKLAAALPNGAEAVANLTKDLPDDNAALQKLIEIRRAEYSPVSASPVRGAALYTAACAVCHQIDGQGGMIGPQLDGIGNRGLERLLEDVIDPNRNVDRAFRTHLFTLKNGDVVTGLPRREEGEIAIVADAAGRELSIAKKEIQTRVESESSLMPANFGELFTSEQMQDLMAFLLSKGAPPAGQSK